MGSTLTVEGFGTHTVSSGGAGGNLLLVRNTTAGTGNSAQIRLGNDASAAAALLVQTSSTYTTGAQYVQSGFTVEAARVGGLILAATDASGTIRFFTGGTTQRGSIDALGRFKWTTTGDHDFTGSSVGANALSVVNTNAGTGASAQFYVGNDASVSLGRLIATSSAFTVGATVYQQSGFILEGVGAGGIVLSASHASGAIRFHTGGSTSYQWIMQNSGTLDWADPDVAHGMTDICATTTYGRMGIYDGVGGGVALQGLSEGLIGIQVSGLATTESAARTTSANAPVMIVAALKSVATIAGLAADQNIVVFRNNTLTQFILDSDGDSHQNVGTAWTNFSTHDDVGLLAALSAGVSRRGDPVKRNFGSFLAKHRSELERLKVVSFNDGRGQDKRPFVNMSKLTMLLVGAAIQNGRRMAAMEKQLRRLMPA